MTTILHDPADVAALVAAHAFADVGAARGAGGVGIEVEVFPFAVSDGFPRRVALDDLPGNGPTLIRRLDAVASARSWLLGRSLTAGVPSFGVADGGRLTFEPGGQLEVSTVVAPGPSIASDAASDVLGRVAMAAATDNILLGSCGEDPFSTTDEVAQQLAAPRYRAMAAYLAARGPAGARMMRHTASIQINLDPGRDEVRVERWLLANLVAPVTIATFACSAGQGPISRRARTWAETDPTRTGVPRTLATSDDPVEHVTEAALSADVLLVRTAEGGAVAGHPGFRFVDWVATGAASPFGRPPTDDDLRYHLSTLFHEVRPRGPLELRSVDALPARWRCVPVTLLAGLLYDDTARRRVLELLLPRREAVHAELHAAACEGLAEPSRCALAVEVWSYALDGAQRLQPAVWDRDLDACRAFIDRYTLRGRCPSDELRERLDDGPGAALAFIAEPLPSGVRP